MSNGKLLINKLTHTSLIFLGALFFVTLFNLMQVSSETETVSQDFRPGEVLLKVEGDEEFLKIKFDGGNPENISAEYARASLVEYAEPNYIYEATLIPDDPGFAEQASYLKKIKAPAAWDLSQGSRNTIIAVLDTGVSIENPDIKGNVWRNEAEIPANGKDDDLNGYVDDINGWDFSIDSPDPNPKFDDGFSEIGVQHGTIVAGIAAARGGNEEGVAGVTWHSQIMPLRVLNAKGVGDAASVARAVKYARQKGAHIINLSFVGKTDSKTLSNELQKAYDQGILVLAASGNQVSSGVNLNDNPRFPICSRGANGEKLVMGVSALDLNNRVASFANFGSQCVDVSAPGIRLYSTVHRDTTRGTDYLTWYGGNFWSGTSVAVPQVAGTAALIRAVRPNISLIELRNIITSVAGDVDNVNQNIKGQLGGLLDVFGAVKAAMGEREPARAETALIPGIAQGLLFTGAGPGGGPHIRAFNSRGQIAGQFFAYPASFTGGVKVASGDLDGDKLPEVVTGAGSGTLPLVQVFDPNGKRIAEFNAYAENFQGGVNVAVGDVDGDGEIEIVTSPASRGGPHIRVFDRFGKLESQFFARDFLFRGGLSLAVGDVTGDGRAEIITTPVSGRSVLVSIHGYEGTKVSSFFGFPENYRIGASLAAGDVDADGLAEIVVGAGRGGGPQVRVFNRHGQVEFQFFAFRDFFRGGINVAVGNIFNSPQEEIIVAAAKNFEPRVFVFNNKSEQLLEFLAYNKNFRGGVNVAASK